jgi:hypothetical protein
MINLSLVVQDIAENHSGTFFDETSDDAFSYEANPFAPSCEGVKE